MIREKSSPDLLSVADHGLTSLVGQAAKKKAKLASGISRNVMTNGDQKYGNMENDTRSPV